MQKTNLYVCAILKLRGEDPGVSRSVKYTWMDQRGREPLPQQPRRVPVQRVVYVAGRYAVDKDCRAQ
jgi:hypothetical protein